MSDTDAQLNALAVHMGQRRDEVLRRWRHAVRSDAQLKSAAALPRQQLNDHIPALLIDFERALAEGSAAPGAALTAAPQRDAEAHGVKRWQQGFDLGEVARELGRLNECVVSELDARGMAQPMPAANVMATARALWAHIVCLAVSASTAQYDRLRQAEAADQIHDLEQALTALRDLEQQRAQLWQQAAHDLRGNLGVVANATAGLSASSATADTRQAFLRLLDRNVAALHRVLDDVTTLAHLQAGHQQRRPAPMDAAALLRALCNDLQPQADQRALALTVAGPSTLPVEGDAALTERIARHLLLETLRQGGNGGNGNNGSITLAWGAEPAGAPGRWFMEVRHNWRPPRLPDGPGVPLGMGMGIGIAIVKQLCELLDAAFDVDSSAAGTTLRIALPVHYPA